MKVCLPWNSARGHDGSQWWFILFTFTAVCWPRRGSSTKLCMCRGHLCPVGGEIKLLSRGQDALEGCLKSSAERPLVSLSAYSGHLSSLWKLPTQLSGDKGRDAASIQKQSQEGTWALLNLHQHLPLQDWLPPTLPLPLAKPLAGWKPVPAHAEISSWQCSIYGCLLQVTGGLMSSHLLV